jgi:NAD(P)-dependent dehydrogenase (short-subunit alcohol dehydrogenase family)
MILNAAMEHSGAIRKLEPGKLSEVIGTNLIGNLNLATSAINRGEINPHGQISFIGSIAADGNHDQLAYSASKAGLRGAVNSMLQDGTVKDMRIGAKLIEPAFIRTPMAERALKVLERRAIKTKGGDELVQEFRDKGYVMSPEFAAQRVLELTVDPEVTGRVTIPDGADLREIRARYIDPD